MSRDLRHIQHMKHCSHSYLGYCYRMYQLDMVLDHLYDLRHNNDLRGIYIQNNLNQLLRILRNYNLQVV